MVIPPAGGQTLPTPISTPVTANSTTGELRTPANFWTANSANISSSLSLNTTYQPLSGNLTMLSAYNATTLPISSATQTALDLKLNTATAASSYQPHSSNLTSLAGSQNATTLVAALALKADANSTVALAGNQTIAGAKSFNSTVDISTSGSRTLGSYDNVLTVGGLSSAPIGTLTSGGQKRWAIRTGIVDFTASTGIYAGQREIDTTAGFGYNPTSGAPNDDVQWGEGFEARYLNGQSDLSSEWYLAWKSKAHGPGNALYLDRRPIQVNVSHSDSGIAGNAFKVDWLLSAESWVILGSSNRTATNAGGSLSNDRWFRVFLDSPHVLQFSGNASIDGNISSQGGVLNMQGTAGANVLAGQLDIQGTNSTIRIGTSSGIPARIDTTTAGSQALTFYRGTASEWFRLGAGAGDTLLPNSNEFSVRSVGSSAGTTRPLIFRSSTDGGTTFTRGGTWAANGNRWIFGDRDDDGASRVQVGGAVVSYPSASATALGVSRSTGYNVAESWVGSGDGGYFATRRTSTEMLRIGSGRGDTETGLNNGHAIDIVGGNNRPLFIRTSANGTSYTTVATIDQSNTRLNLGSGWVYAINGSQVVGARDTGWTAATGTSNKGSYSTYAGATISATPTQAEVQAINDALKAASERIKALEDMLRTHGLIN